MESTALNSVVDVLVALLPFIGVGFAAQMIDGTLGMAYGVSSNTFLLLIGIEARVASACIHVSEVFTTAVSGLAHWRFGNVDKKLWIRLIIPGVIGGVLGAYVLSSIDGKIIQPFVMAYLSVMGVVILLRGVRKVQPRDVSGKKYLVPLAGLGGLLDAVGGGGWGPVVTTHVIAAGHDARKTIGSVNSSEFFVTTAEAVTFLIMIPALIVKHWVVIGGLLLGGVIAAPLGAWLTRKLPHRVLLVLVGLIILASSAYKLVTTLPSLLG